MESGGKYESRKSEQMRGGRRSLRMAKRLIKFSLKGRRKVQEDRGLGGGGGGEGGGEFGKEEEERGE